MSFIKSQSSLDTFREQIHSIHIDEGSNESNIKNEACRILSKLRVGGSRKDKRKKIIIFCLYQAYLNLGLYRDVVHIGSLIQLDYSQSINSITCFQKKLINSPNDKIPHHNGIVEPEKIIRYYCSHHCFALDDNLVDEIIEYYENVLEKNEMLVLSRKITLISAVIYKYMKEKHIPVDLTKYASVFSLSQKMIMTELEKFS